ncbi:hypothetical protein [Amycolatopsis sp. cg13]|uniref:hypothetical protein n=1 Tax=Amycolatopsis sp. cg13 TaxID=3238807 RepID=UPI0035232861
MRTIASSSRFQARTTSAPPGRIGAARGGPWQGGGGEYGGGRPAGDEQVPA